MVLSIKTLFSYVLIVGTTMSLFTSLRFSFFGLGELLIIFTFFLTNFKKIPIFNLQNYPFTIFWVIYIFSALIGSLFNLAFINNQTGSLEKLSIDLFAYIFILATSFTLEANINLKAINPWNILKGFILFSSSILTLLLVISFFTDGFFGLKLMYEKNFAPMVDNVHQIAMFYILLPFLCLGIYLKEIEINPKKNNFVRFVTYFSLLSATAYMAITATATKSIIGFWLGVICLIFFYLISKSGSILRSLFIYLLFVLIALLFFYLDLYSMFIKFFTEADVDGGRAYFYGTAINLFSESPVFGRGPGGHIWMGQQYWDVHQTFLTILVQAGVIGFVSFLLLLMRFLKDIFKESIFLASMVPLLIYALGGDILRRLPVWILIILLMYAIKYVRSNDASDSSNLIT